MRNAMDLQNDASFVRRIFFVSTVVVCVKTSFSIQCAVLITTAQGKIIALEISHMYKAKPPVLLYFNIQFISSGKGISKIIFSFDIGCINETL